MNQTYLSFLDKQIVSSQKDMKKAFDKEQSFFQENHRFFHKEGIKMQWYHLHCLYVTAESYWQNIIEMKQKYERENNV